MNNCYYGSIWRRFKDINALNFNVIRLLSLIDIDKLAPNSTGYNWVTYVTKIFHLEIVEYLRMDRKGKEKNIICMRL